MKTDRRREAHDDKPHWLTEKLDDATKEALESKDRPKKRGNV
jgi:hypothetical protein